MRHIKISALVLGICLLASATLTAQNTTQRQRLEQHVYTLAADSLNGRQAGSPDAVRAANYITRQWREMGLKPLWNNDYRMPFETHGTSGYNNLIAIIEGNDPELKNEYIVIGGHYDHLGVRKGKIYNGADDNASGTACVTEVARQLLAHQGELKRSVIICAFDAEEMGLYGSNALAEYMQKNNLIGRVQLMVSIDMVGWLKQGGSLTLEGTGTLLHSNQLTDPELLGIPIKITSKRFENSIFTATDTEPFVTDYMAAFTLRAANRHEPIPSGQVAPKHRSMATPINIGISAGFNNSRLSFPTAAFNSKELLGWQAGLALQFNLKNKFSLHTDILYTYSRTPYPDPLDLYSNTLRLRQHALTVPVMLQINIGEPTFSAYLNFGGYYSYSIASQFYHIQEPTHAHTLPTDLAPCCTHQYGIAWGFGFRLGYNWNFGCTFLYQLNPLFEAVGMPRTLNTMSSFNLTYYFL